MFTPFAALMLLMICYLIEKYYVLHQIYFNNPHLLQNELSFIGPLAVVMLIFKCYLNDNKIFYKLIFIFVHLAEALKWSPLY